MLVGLLPSKPAPKWFHGQELDALEPRERDQLYRDIAGGLKRANWVLPIIAVSNLANMIRGLRSEQDRWLWIAFAIFLMALMIAAPILRRMNILRTARRTLRESSDWPLTRLSRFGGADPRP